jgi:hypothetical protein
VVQVCLWTDLEEGSLPNCVKMLCDGHHEYDVLPFNKFKVSSNSSRRPWHLYSRTSVQNPLEE